MKATILRNKLWHIPRNCAPLGTAVSSAVLLIIKKNPGISSRDIWLEFGGTMTRKLTNSALRPLLVYQLIRRHPVKSKYWANALRKSARPERRTP